MTERKPAKRDATHREGPALSARWAAAILALLVVMFFHEVVLEGKTFVSPDATAPAGFARMGEASLYQQHVYPQWNPYVFLGMPSFGSGTYNPLIYPPDWPIAVLQKYLPLPDLTWMLIYYFLAAFATFLLAREWGARAEAAVLAGVAFVFAPNLVAVGSHGHGSQLVDSAYLPLMLWLATRWMRRGALSDLAWLALAGGFQLLRGHVQICFYTWLAVGGYAVVDGIAALGNPARRAAAPRALGVFLAAALALGVAGFYNLPLADYARESIRGTREGGGVGMSYATQWSLGPEELPSIVVPGWAGFGGQTYWGSMPFTDYPNAYVGLITILLALPAFFAGGATRVFALLLAVGSLLISFGNHFPLYGFLYNHVPYFNKFRVPVMIVLLFQMATAMGLAWGWSAWCDPESVEARRGKSMHRLLIASAALLALGFLVVALASGGLEGAYTAMVVARRSLPGQPYPAELAGLAWHGFAADFMRGAALGLASLGLAWAVSGRKLSARMASAGVLVLMLIELFPVSGRVMQPAVGDLVRGEAALGRDDVVEFLEKAGPQGSFRIIPFQEFQNNRYSGFAIASVGGYHAAKPRLAQDLIEHRAPETPAWWRLLNVRYLVMPQAIEAPPGLNLVHQGSQVIYENQFALPRATVLGHYAVVQPDSAILDSISVGSRDAAEWTYLSSDPQLTLGSTTGATATIVSYRLNDVTVDVDTPGDALLRLADLWYPDWVARVDGKQVPILRADYLLRAVAIPKGRHRVEFRFESVAMRRGLQLSLASLTAILAMFAAAWLMRRREKGTAQAA